MRHLAVVLCALGVLAAGVPAQPPRPNVVLVMTDDQGYGDLGFHGNPVLDTPHLDALAAESARLERFYVCPVCAPTRAGLMTGRYHYRTGVVDTWHGRAMMHPGEVTVAEVLRGAGYATGLFGKWHLGDCYPMRPVDQGFEEAVVHLGGGIGQASDPPGGEGRYTDPVLFHNGARVQAEGYCTGVYVDHALRWIGAQARADRPFFATITPNCPHGPFHDVPEAVLAKYAARDLANAAFPERGHPLPEDADLDRRARIFAMVDDIDAQVGRLLEGLDDLGITDNTLVLFLVDNGPDGRRYAAGLRGQKGEVWEGGIRSPLLARWPSRLRAGRVVEQVGGYIDVMPTLLDACGVAVPAGLRLDGRSLLPALLGEERDAPERTLVIQAHRGDAPVLGHHFAAIGARWKLVHPTGFHREQPGDGVGHELYDLRADPFELRDRAADEPEVVAAMRREYQAWFVDVTATRPAAPPRIVVGSYGQDPVTLTRQDWRHLPGDRSYDRGRWLLRVDRAGPYRATLRFEAAQAGERLHVLWGGAGQQLDVDVGVTAMTVVGPPLPAAELAFTAELRGGARSRGVHQVDLAFQDPVERVATGFEFVEGPAWNAAAGALYFSDIPAAKIHRLGPDGAVTAWREDTGNANGLAFDAAGRLLACCGGARQLVRIEPDGTATVLAERFEGRRLNSPNDLAVDADGGVWFTDPRYGDRSDLEQEGMAVYHVDAAGTLRRAITDIERPNGIVLDRTGRTLYVADPEQRAVRAYPVLGPGAVGAGRTVFVGDPDVDGAGPDGMALDVRGRLYTTYQGVNVHAPDGTLLRRIAVPERPANCTFGGADLRTLFVTARTSLYRVRVDVPGFARGPHPGFAEEVVDGDIGVGYGVAVADMDADGRPDLVLVDQDDVAWYRNPTWQREVVAHRLSGDLHHVCIAARDLDGDGRAELAAGAAWNPGDTVGSGSVHALRRGAGGGGWRADPLPHEPTVHRMRWLRGPDGFELVVAPLHGRGNVRATGAGARVLAYDPAAAAAAPALVDGGLHQVHNLDPVAWDDDAEEEILLAAREGVFLLDRDGAGGWRRTGLTDSAASEARGGRGPSGRRFVATVEPFHGHQLVVHTEDAAGGAWSPQVVLDDLAQGHAVATGDLLGLGHDQIVVGWREPNAAGEVGIRLLRPEAAGGWRSETLSRAIACEDLRLADLDGDGDLDVVACGRASHDLRVLWNLR